MHRGLGHSGNIRPLPGSLEDVTSQDSGHDGCAGALTPHRQRAPAHPSLSNLQTQRTWMAKLARDPTALAGDLHGLHRGTRARPLRVTRLLPRCIGARPPRGSSRPLPGSLEGIAYKSEIRTWLDARSADASSATLPADCEVYASDMMLSTWRRSGSRPAQTAAWFAARSETISVKRNGKSLGEGVTSPDRDHRGALESTGALRSRGEVRLLPNPAAIAAGSSCSSPSG